MSYETARFRVMVVDDDPDIRLLATMALASEYDVFEATNGLDAMLKLTRYEPDVALIDIMMPLMNGLELVGRIRNTPGFGDMPVIALSALQTTEDIKRGYTAGVNVYLTKPFEPERLLKNIAVSTAGRSPRPKTLTIGEVEDRERKYHDMVKGAIERRTSTDSIQMLMTHLPGSSDRVVRRFADARTPTDTQVPAHLPATPHAEKPADPFLESAPPPLPRTSRLARRDEQAPRLMLIDDEEASRPAIRAALEPDVEVVAASDGFEAVSLIPTYEPDLLLIAATVPRLSGYQLVDLLRGTNETRLLPVLFVLPRMTARERSMMEQKGVRHCFARPLDPREVRKVVLDITDDPAFPVHRKSRRYLDLLQEEEQALRAEGSGGKSVHGWQSFAEISQFLHANSTKEPLKPG